MKCYIENGKVISPITETEVNLSTKYEEGLEIYPSEESYQKKTIAMEIKLHKDAEKDDLKTN